MSDLAPVPLPASDATSPHTEILRTNSAMMAQAASGTGSPERVMMILNLCRESNPSADALAQLLRDPSTSAGVNYEDVNSMTPLIEATARGHTHLLPVLIASGADLEHLAAIPSVTRQFGVPSGTKQAFSALHVAITTGQLDAVKVLVRSGASLHVVDQHGRSPWSLVAGASVPDVNYVPELRNVQRATTIPLISAYMRSLSDLLEICKSSAATLEGAQACLYDAPELSHLRLMFPSVKGFTPLHEASARGHADIVDFLIDSKADVNATTFIFMQNSDDSKETPMHLAAANGHSRVVASLVRAGADIGALSAKGASALHLSFGSDGKQHLDVVRVIVEEMIAMSKIRSNCDSINRIINSADGFNCSPLHAAAKGGSLPIVQLLLSVKTVDVNKTNIYGQTPLHVASTHGHSWAVRAIAKYRECGVNVRMQEKARDSCLHLAAKRGHVNVLIELGAAGAHLLNEIKDSTGRIKSLHIISNDSSDRLSPIDVAQGDQARNFLEKAVDIFRLCQGEHVGSGGMGIKSILADPDTRQSFLSFRTSSNNTPLHIAVKSQNIEAVKDILACYGKSVDGQICDGHGVDCNVTNGDGMSALDLMDESDSAAIKAISATRNFNMELFNIICCYEVTSEEV